MLPSSLWSNGPTDVGLIKNADPVKVKVISKHRPMKPQYPLSAEARDGIRPVIADMVKAGILIKTAKTTCNTPIFPVKKANTGKYRLVHDLRAINDITEQIPPIVANPHTLLNHVSPREQWFSVIDLSNAFFSVPLHPESRGLFGFTFDGQRYTYTRLPQGFQNSPTLYAEALKQSMSSCTLPAPGQFLLYVDDILVTGNTQDDCRTNTLVVLRHLAEQGHKVSQHKLQLWQPKVVYLGHELTGQGRRLLDSRKTAVQTAPKPLTKQQMMSFLGLCNYCRSWIPEFALRAQPLQDLIYGKDMALTDKLTWTAEAETAFANLKLALQTSMVLALPDYDKPFYLYVDGGAGYMKAVLTQAFGDKQRPLAFYSCKLDSVASGLPTCVQACAAAAEAVKKSADIILGHPLIVKVPHAVTSILLQANLSYLTHARQLSYVGILLSQSHINIEKCGQLNPSTLLPVETDGDTHSCLHTLDEETKPRADIYSSPQTTFADIFVDGSASKDSTGKNCVGYAVTTVDTVIEARPLTSANSAQSAELTAVIRACELHKDKDVNIHTDSQYVFAAVHHFAKIWQNRGMITSTGAPVQHGSLLKKLLQVITLPRKLALCKCAAHQTDDSYITKGNNFADNAAKEAAQQKPNVFTFTSCSLIPLEVLKDEQKAAPQNEKSSWLKDGAILKDDIMTCNGKPILPKSLHKTAALVTHGNTHVSPASMVDILSKQFYSKNFENSAKAYIRTCMICQKHNAQGNLRPKRGQFPTPPHPFHTIHIDFIQLHKHQQVEYALVIIDVFSRWPEIYPVKKNDAISVAKCLCNHFIPTYGIPSLIRSDNGTHFVNEVISKVSEALGFSIKHHCSYHPQSAGLVERTNGTIKQRLRKCMAETGRPWPECVGLVKMWMRLTQGSQKLTPFEIVHGRPFPLPVTSEPIDKSIRETTLAEWMTKLLENKEIVLNNQLPDDSLPVSSRLKPGDWILIKVLQRKNWSSPRWEGPYQVLLATPTACKLLNDLPGFIRATVKK
uniref:ribonuclease H n=1 Tax=Oreochromis niloticus TaxID=8128 RepID=A0A669C837_ORENI